MKYYAMCIVTEKLELEGRVSTQRIRPVRGVKLYEISDLSSIESFERPFIRLLL